MTRLVSPPVSGVQPSRLRRFFQSFQRSRLKSVIQIYPESSLTASAIVFAPHQDDETLGCGGTIARKRQAGAKVTIVYLTDGSGTYEHLALLPPAELARIREQEAIAAAQTLGVAAADVIFLRFKDGALKASSKEAIAKVADILQQVQPQEVFIPYRFEPQFIPDHGATNHIVRAALAQVKPSLQPSLQPLTVYEFPIWAWFNYPWVDLIGDPVFPKPKGIVYGLMLMYYFWRSLWFAYCFYRDFRCAVDVSEYLDQKHQALYQHQSQMTPFQGDPRWQTVADVAHGEFLSYFFQAQELFYRYHP